MCWMEGREHEASGTRSETAFKRHRQPGVAGTSRRWHGQSMVELALMMPLIALILLGTVDLGRVFFAYTRLTHSVKEGALYGMRFPKNITVSPGPANTTTCAGQQNIKCLVIQESGTALALTENDITVECYKASDGTKLLSCTSGLSRGDGMVVTANHTFRPLTSRMAGLFPGGVKLKKSVRVVIL